MPQTYLQKPGRLPCFTPLKWTIEAEKTHGFCDFSGGHILSCSTLEEPGGAHRSEVSVRGRRASTEILEVVRDLDRWVTPHKSVPNMTIAAGKSTMNESMYTP